jgi:pimeloyl-ACP methyl ester carboxylesterase
MRSHTVLCLDSAAFHRMHYYEWGAADNERIVLCVHGLTRTGRDFDALARALAPDFRVICPDLAGRGGSDWLTSKSDYSYPQYLADLTTLIARLTRDADRKVAWVGTSMGALIGIVMAARDNHPVSRLVVNDAGAMVPQAALQRIGEYVGRNWRFDTLEALEAHLRAACAPFGPLTDAQWRHLAVHSSRQLPDGAWGMNYDPAIGEALRGELGDIDLSAQWDAVDCPALVLRGAESDVLLAATAAQMVEGRENAKLVEFAGVGHAPMLMSDEQIAVVREFLLSA